MLPLTLVLTANLLAQASPAQTTPVPAPAAPRQITAQERGDIYMARKMYREAIDTYKEAPESAVILNKIGIAYHQLGDLDTAAKYYSRATKKDSKYVEAINNLGTVYYSRKSFRRAITAFKKALKLSPESASTWANLANAYFERNQFELSSEAMDKALSIDPHVFDSHSSAGSIVQERNIGDRAKYDYFRAKTYAKAGKNAEAIMYIRRALEEGFKEREKFNTEPEFAGLKDDPDFKQLMSTEPKTL